MADNEESGFKVTDRRKYNPDGSPREATESNVAPAAPAPEAPPPFRESDPDNVVSFPGEATQKRPESDSADQSEPEASPTRATEPAPSAANQATATGPAPAAADPAVSQAEQAYNRARGPSTPGLPEASFLGLVNMLAVEAAMHLGLLRNPGEEPPPVDLESGRHLIDLLGMLQTKTRGSLTTEEDNLLENVLADLRMQFVAVSKRR